MSKSDGIAEIRPRTAIFAILGLECEIPPGETIENADVERFARHAPPTPPRKGLPP
jgi:hypothetical protein